MIGFIVLVFVTVTMFAVFCFIFHLVLIFAAVVVIAVFGFIIRVIVHG